MLDERDTEANRFQQMKCMKRKLQHAWHTEKLRQLHRG